MSLQELLDIACRHFTSMADAMVAACLQKAVETGEAIIVRCERERRGRRGERPREDTDWRALVEGNTDTRRTHV